MENSTFDKKERRRRYLVVGAWLAMVVYIALVPGSGVDGLYQCPFNALTGYDCPGCGMTRASIHAFHFEFADSLAYNPFGIPFVVGFTLLAGFRGAELLRGGPITIDFLDFDKKTRNRIWFAVLVVAMTFGIGRLVLEIAGILTPL